MTLFLKKQGYAIENTFISFYSAIFSAYVNCNLDPVSKTIWLTDEDLENIDGQLSLRLKFVKGVSKQFTDNYDDVEVEHAVEQKVQDGSVFSGTESEDSGLDDS